MTILTALLEATLGAWLIAAVIGLLRLCCRRMLSPKAKYYLWALLALRLMLPVLPESPLSLMNFLPQRETVTVSETAPTPVSTQPVPAQTETKTATLPAITAPLPEQSVPLQSSAPVSEPVPETDHSKLVWQTVVLWGWLGGVGVTLLVYLVLYTVTALQLRRLPPVTDPDTLRVFLNLKRELGIRGRVKLVSGGGGMLGGLLRPTIVIPAELQGQEVAPILVHELLHYKYKDLWVSLLCRILTALHWFNPVVWLCFHILRNDSEAACDQRVLESDLVERERYATVLYEEGVLQMKNSILMQTTFGGDGRSLKRRIRLIAQFRRPKVWMTVLTVVLALVISACTLTGAQSDSPEPTQEPSSMEEITSRELSIEDICGNSTLDAGAIQAAAEGAMGMLWDTYEAKLMDAIEAGDYSNVTLSLEGRPAYFIVHKSPDGTRTRAIRFCLADDSLDDEAWLSYTEQVTEKLSGLCTEKQSFSTYLFDSGKILLEFGPVHSEDYEVHEDGTTSYAGIPSKLGNRILEFSITFDSGTPSAAASLGHTISPYVLSGDGISYGSTQWGMTTEQVFAAEGLDEEAWRYVSQSRSIMPREEPVLDHPEVTDLVYYFNYTGPELEFGLNLVITRYDTQAIGFDQLVAQRTTELGSPGFQDETKASWEFPDGTALLLINDEDILDERLTASMSQFADGTLQNLDVEAYMEDLQAPNGHFGWTFDRHVEAGLLDPNDGTLESRFEEEDDSESLYFHTTTELGGYEVPITYLFHKTLVSEEAVLTQVFVTPPEGVVYRDWVESFWDPWKDKLYEQSSLHFSSPVMLSSLLPEDTQRELIDQLNERGDRTDATLTNWSLMVCWYEASANLWQFNGTGAALYLTATEAQ